MKEEKKPKKIQKIKITRKVEKTVTYKKIIDKEVEVEPRELSEDEIYSLDAKYAQAMAVFYKRKYEEAMDLNSEILNTCKHTVITTKTEPQQATQDIKIEKTDNVSPEQNKAVVSHPRNDIGIGSKKGISSKYHYVYYDRTNTCWKSCFESTRYKTEIEAALAADEWVKNNDNKKKRPFNRNEFKEVMEAYGSIQEQSK